VARGAVTAPQVLIPSLASRASRSGSITGRDDDSSAGPGMTSLGSSPGSGDASVLDARIAHVRVPEGDAHPDSRRTDLLLAQASLVMLGLGMIAIGAVPVVATLAGAVIDEARLASYWPAIMIAIGFAVIAEAVVLRATAVRLPVPDTAGTVTIGLAPAAIPEPSPGPETREPVSRPEERASHLGEGMNMGAEWLHSAPDVRAALVELRSLRRERLISKKQYRTKRRSIVAGMELRFSEDTPPEGETPADAAGAAGTRPPAHWEPTAGHP
jgi:hypothetical protein